jgi:hypothetical protein
METQVSCQSELVPTSAKVPPAPEQSSTTATHQPNRAGEATPATGPWSGAAVSGILDNPKYTGFQVWNRRRRKTRRQPDERRDGVGVVEHADDLRAVLRQGDPEDRRRIFRRTIRSVTWLPEEERLELRLVLPEPEDEPAERRVDSVRARGGIRTHTPLPGQALLRRRRLPVPTPGLDPMLALRRKLGAQVGPPLRR